MSGGRLAVLAAGSLATGTSGYCMTAVLPAMSRHLGLTPATAGQLVTVFAAACAVAGPLVIGRTATWSRRRLVVAALLITAAGNLATAVAPTTGLLVAARILTAGGVAVYVPAASALAATLTAAHHHARAMALVVAGLTAALLLGVPAATVLLAILGGYQVVFVVIAGLCLLATVAITLNVPVAAGFPAAAPGTPPHRTRRTWRTRGGGHALAYRRVLALVGAAYLGTVATIAPYTYIAWLLRPATATLPLGVLLAAYGTGALLGNLLCGRLSDRYDPARVLLAATLTSAVTLPAVTAATTTPTVLMLVLTVWGAAGWSIYAPITVLLTRHADQTGEPVTSLLSVQTSAIYAGMATGGLAGGLVLAGAGVGTVPLAAAGIAAAAAGLVYLGAIRRPSPTAGTT